MTQSKGEMSRQALYQQIETRILTEMRDILMQSLDDGPHDGPRDNPLSTLSSLAYVLEIVATASATRIARTQEN